MWASVSVEPITMKRMCLVLTNESLMGIIFSADNLSLGRYLQLECAHLDAHVHPEGKLRLLEAHL